MSRHTQGKDLVRTESIQFDDTTRLKLPEGVVRRPNLYQMKDVVPLINKKEANA